MSAFSVEKNRLTGLSSKLEVRSMMAAEVFNVFDDLGLEGAASQGESDLSLVDRNGDWQPGTQWADQPWDEDDVFNAELNHSSDDLDWSIRIGEGGQLYSWNLDGQELLPPQGGTTQRSPWVDDVILQTWRDSENFDNDATQDGDWYGNTFVHGAGIYNRPDLDPASDPADPFYNPLLEESFDASDRSYSTMNWGPTVTPSINRGDVMLYNQYRHLGDNVLEITSYGYNFGENTYDDIAMPWSMVRDSVFPNTIKGTAAGSGFENFEGTYPTRFQISEEGGWLAKTADASDPNALTISSVHGLDRHLGESWQTVPSLASSGTSSVPNSTRDISIMSAFNNGIEVAPGQGFFKRHYMVLGDQQDVIEKSYELADKVDYGIVEFDEASTELLPIYTKISDGQRTLTNEPGGIQVGSTYAMPVKNSVPLFAMRDTQTGEFHLSTDPYALSSTTPFVDDNGVYQSREIRRPYDGNTEWVEMLGYVVPTAEAELTADTVPLSSGLLNSQFTAGETFGANEVLIRTDGARSDLHN